MMVALLPIAVILAGVLIPGSSNGVHTQGFELVGQMPHDKTSFTQGFIYLDGFFYESSGLTGKSSLRRVDPETGQVLAIVAMEDRYFAEGLAHYRGRLVQLTYHSQKAFVYGCDAMEVLETWDYLGQGWGLTFDGRHFVMSDGTSTLTVRDPETFAKIRTISVHDGNQLIDQINELEYIKGEIWANIWLTKKIVRISPKDGKVLGYIDLSGLLKPKDRNRKEDHLNGIAYDPAGDRIFVTGKYYSYVYEIKPGKRIN